MADVTFEAFLECLKELSPYVYVVGSYARGKQRPWSDLDLYVKVKPEEYLMSDAFDPETEDDTYLPEVIALLEKYGITWDSDVVSQVFTINAPLLVEASTLFHVPENPAVFEVDLWGVKMPATLDTYVRKTPKYVNENA